MSKLPRISDLDEGAAGWSFYLCARKEVRTDRAGATFVALTLQDASGQIPAKIFAQAGIMSDEFDAGEFVKAAGVCSRHHQRLELVVERIRRVNPEQDRQDGFREEDCIPSAPRPIDEMWAELLARIEAVEDPWIRKLLLAVVRERESRLRTWPAAVTVHHAYRGGLLEHVLTLAATGGALAAAYGVSPDLMLAGALLHDIGKLEELSYDGAATYSREGNLLGHITIGVMMVRTAASNIEGFPPGLLSRIEHMVVSHHGERALGSPVEPMTEEAFILSAIDDLDARLHQFRRHVQQDARGEGDFTTYHPRLGRVLLKPSGR